MNLLITHAEVTRRIVDVRLRGSTIAEVARNLRPTAGEDVLDARGGALLPGLHDHHLHLLATAAAAQSTDCGPPRVRTPDELREILRGAAAGTPPAGWIRGVGYHESVAGMLERHGLDRMCSSHPVRIQHRGGALWILNSAALVALGPALDRDTSGDVERDPDGQPTGRLWRYDARLRTAVDSHPPRLEPLGARLAVLGITGVTDATPDEDGSSRAIITAALHDGHLPQRVHLLGTAAGDEPAIGVTTGPRKLLLADHRLPHLDELAADIAAVHTDARAVAVHCVTRESLLLTLAALDVAGTVAGDRIEHAAVVPPEIRADLARRGLLVVTQPSFITARGDEYLSNVEADDQDLLYPYASLLAAGVPVAPSSDAPFGNFDPWAAIAAATHRRTATGVPLAQGEAVSAHTALAGFLSPPDNPGGPPRRIAAGQPADLCLLAEPVDTALAHPSADLVTTTIRAGRVVHQR
jgi:predicted amidohydrolase YtcJ